MRKLYLAMGMALVAMLVAAGAVYAAVTFDEGTGTGFVGKGDVQLIFGWNNTDLQKNAKDVTFTATRVTERSWVCTNENNENTQERERTTTSQNVASHIARVKNQITGFNLTGYGSTIGTPTTEGPPLNSCPSGPWSLTTPAGDPKPVPGATKLYVNYGDQSVQIYP